MELREGAVLGVVEPFPTAHGPEFQRTTLCESACCAQITAEEPDNDERNVHLLDALGFSQGDLTAEEFDELKSLLCEFSDVFALESSELGCTDCVQHVIETGDHPPIKQQPYRTPVVHREKIAKLVEEMQQQEIIQPSSSPWASPVVLVPKKDGTDRFCIDYRRLNAVTRKDVYPLPHIDDILDTLGQRKFFSTLDLSSGFWQIELDPASRPKSAFTTYQEFVRMPYGLCNAPATFQRLMQVVLAGLEWKSCFVYIDDILVASKTFSEHLSDLRQVFT